MSVGGCVPPGAGPAPLPPPPPRAGAPRPGPSTAGPPPPPGTAVFPAAGGRAGPRPVDLRPHQPDVPLIGKEYVGSASPCGHVLSVVIDSHLRHRYGPRIRRIVMPSSSGPKLSLYRWAAYLS